MSQASEKVKNFSVSLQIKTELKTEYVYSSILFWAH